MDEIKRTDDRIRGSNSTQNETRNAGICISCGKPMIVPANQMDGLKHKECEQSTQNDWAERFDKHYGDYGEDDFGSCSVECELRMENIKKFIAKELADARKEVYREIAGHFIKICGDDVLATQKEERV